MVGDKLTKNPHNISLERLTRMCELIDRLGLEILIEEIEDNQRLSIADGQESENSIALRAKSTPDRISSKSYRHFRLTIKKDEQQIVVTTSVLLITKDLFECGNCNIWHIRSEPNRFLSFIETLNQHERAVYQIVLWLSLSEENLDYFINNKLYLWAEASEYLDALQSHPDYMERSFQYQRETILKLVEILGEDEVRGIING